LADLLLFPLIALLRTLFGKRQRAGDNAARDRLELACLERAQAARLPVLGICRGAQLLNIFLGGRLRRELAAFYEEGHAVRSILPRKRIFIEENSRLAHALGTTSCRVNALHRQAIDDRHLGAGLAIVAREASGVVQAVESGGDWPVLGVQWHPEYLPQRREQLGLFRELARLAARRPVAR
ncbi:MAG: gamma-glutamyl-gamma-aminobutyrate hydrolase family protein, partial [Gammaproteobacteria bacterium]